MQGWMAKPCREFNRFKSVTQSMKLKVAAGPSSALNNHPTKINVDE